MSERYVVMLKGVRLTTTSVLRVTENAVASNLTVIDPSTGSALASTKTFYLRGDGSDDDLLQVLVETIQSHAGVNTYTASLTWSVDPSAVSGVVTITRASGANDFQINWSHASTTIEPTWFGFTDADTANNGSAKSGTLSPSVAWVSPQPPEIFEEFTESDVEEFRARESDVRLLRRGGPYALIDVRFTLCDSRRVLRTDNTSDTAATFASFLEQVGAGSRVELHLQTVTGSAVDALTIYTRAREYWQLDEQSSEAFRPRRFQEGMALFGWGLVFHGFGETTPEPPEEVLGLEEEFETADGW